MDGIPNIRPGSAEERAYVANANQSTTSAAVSKGKSRSWNKVVSAINNQAKAQAAPGLRKAK